LCHLGYFMPQSYQTWPGSTDMKYPNEIDEMLIRLGHSVDSAFQSALSSAADVLGNLDKDPSLNTDGVRDTLHEPFPWLPVRSAPDVSPPAINLNRDNIVEFVRPWSYPEKNNESSTKRDGNFLEGPLTVAGPYPTNTMPNEIINGIRPISNVARVLYENAGCPNDTLLYSEAFIRHQGGVPRGGRGFDGTNPLGDPTPFSAYLIGQIACNPSFIKSNFNLDADRGYGYLCWDWTRTTDGSSGTDARGNAFPAPKTWPEGSFPDGHWIPDKAAAVNANGTPNMHMEANPIPGAEPAIIEADVDVSYFGRAGCVETTDGDPPPPS